MTDRTKFVRQVLLTAGLLAALLALSIGGSLYWRPSAGPGDLLLGETRALALSGVPPETTFSHVAEAVRESVIFLETIAADGRARGQGSGVLIHAAGFALTNWHVVQGAETVRVRLNDGRVTTGDVVGHDRRNDLAVLRVEDPNPLPVARLGDSAGLMVGEWVLAIGAPFGLTSTVSAGIVSTVERRGLGPLGEGPFIQTDAAIHPGNSGGPLVNLRGEVVGINTAIAVDPEVGTGSVGFAGVGFAIPVNRARSVAARLIRLSGQWPGGTSL